MNINEMEITASQTHELWKRSAVRLLDVRGEDERRLAKIENVPMVDAAMAQKMVAEWPKDTPIVFHCHHGVRSLGAVDYFARLGFTNVKSMIGGIDAWSCDVDSSIARY